MDNSSPVSRAVAIQLTQLQRASMELLVWCSGALNPNSGGLVARFGGEEVAFRCVLSARVSQEDLMSVVRTNYGKKKARSGKINGRQSRMLVSQRGHS